MAHPTGVAGNVISQPAFSVGDYSMLIEGVVPKSRESRPTPKAPAPSAPSSRSGKDSGGLPCVECEIFNAVFYCVLTSPCKMSLANYYIICSWFLHVLPLSA